MDPHPLCLLETAYPLRPSTLSAGTPTSRLPPCHRLLTTPTKIFDGPTQMSRPRKGRSFPARESLPNSILAHPTTSRERASAAHLFEDEDDDEARGRFGCAITPETASPA